MSTTVSAPPAKKGRLRLSLAIAGILVIAATAGLLLYLNSDSFRAMLRQKIVAELERATGGKVDLESLSWQLSNLKFQAQGITIHGREAAGETPYVHADDAKVQAGIVSLFGRKLALRSVTLDGLTVHLIVYPDGSTNQPTPASGAFRASSAGGRLFDVAVNHVRVTHGVFLLNQERIPFEVNGQNLSAGLSYSPRESGYDGQIAVSLLSAQWRNRPVQRGDVDLHVLVRQNQAEIKSVKLVSGRSTLEASGNVQDYRNPRLTLNYTAKLDLLEAARIAGWRQVRGGTAELSGRLDYTAGRYSSQGKLGLQKLDWSSPDLRVSNVAATSAFTITPDRLTLTSINSRLLGGAVAGELRVANWNQPNRQNGAASFQVSGLQAEQAIPALNVTAAVKKISFAGSISGSTKATWRGAADKAIAAMVLEITPPQNPTPQQTPLTAQLRSTYNGELKTLDVASLNAATRSVRLNATGKLGSETAQAKLSVNSTDLRELRPLLREWTGARFPVALEGPASFNGSVSGKLNALSARGRLELDNFQTEIALAGGAGGKSQPQSMHWDSLVADIDYHPSLIAIQRGLLRREGSSAAFSGSETLRHGALDARTSQLDLRLNLQGAPLQDLQTLAGTSYPVSGVLNADLHISGTPAEPRGSGRLEVTKMTAWGEPFRLFRSRLQFATNTAQFSDLSLVHNGAELTGTFAWNFSNRNFRFDLTGDNIELASLQRFEFQRLSIEGKVAFHFTGSGTEHSPVLNGNVTVKNLVLNRELVGSVNLDANTQGENLVLRGRSNLENADLTMDGNIRLRGDLPGQMKIAFSHLDFDPLIRAYFKGQITGHSSIAGTIDIHGPFRRPRDLIITGIANQVSAELENVRLQNDGPVRFSMDTEVATLQQCHLVGDNTDASILGSVQVAGEHVLDLHTKGRFNLKLLQGYNPNIIAYGPATFSFDVAGTAAHPQLSGTFNLADAGISLADLPNGLSQINGTLVLAHDRIQIQKLTAKTGGGELQLGGFLAYRNGLYFDLTATGKDVRLRYPPGVSASADATLRYTGSAKSSQLSGDILVTRFGINQRFDFGAYLEQSRKTPGLATMNPFLDNLHLDVHITSTPELRVETSLAKLSGDIDLHLRGTAARPALLGRVNIAEGDIVFNGTKYRLDRGDITFSNPLSIDPVVNIEMSARVQDYDVTIGLHGAVGNGRNLTMTYRSDPPLSNADIIALLAFGRTRSQDVYNASQPGQAGSDSALASNAILGQALDATVGDRVQRLFGASRVKIDPQFIGAENNPSARVTIEQTINNNLTLTYITSLTQSAETVVQLEYNITRNLSVVAVRDENGILSFDVHVRRRKR
ncbi:MAG TPA: translocation/assembly module TamB domain-containing protein [Terriglobales bacterium]|nr:translocation/assembly module TamB domain-containing protein [Terriglobales bacterium]